MMNDTRTVLEKVAELGSLGVVSVVGTVGNILVLSAIILCKDLRNTSNGFIFNLGVADLLICSLVIPMLITARVYRRWLLGDVMCVIQAFINFVCVYSSLFFLAAIALNRIAKTWSFKYYNVIFTPTKSGIIYGLIWMTSVTCSALPILGWGRFAFDNVRDNCIFDRQAAPSYSIFFGLVGITIPLVTCAICYILILVHFIKSRSRVRNLGVITHTSVNQHAEMKLTRNLFLVWVIFFICWTPMITMLFVDPLGLSSRAVYVASVWCLLCNSCLNPIIYGLTNKKFRQGYRRVLLRCIRRNSIHITVQAGSNNVKTSGSTSQAGSNNVKTSGSTSQTLQARQACVG